MGLYVPTTGRDALQSAGLISLIASFLFLAPLIVWYSYSERLASAGGLFAFVESAAGPHLARIQAAFWILSYGLYLLYTIPYIVYDLLPDVIPGISPYQPALQLMLALTIASVVLLPRAFGFSVILGLAGVQVLVALALAVVLLSHLGVPPGSFLAHGNLPVLLQSSGNVSLLYICASLPLYLGGEVEGGGRTVRTGLLIAFATSATLVVLAAVPLAKASRRLVGADVPGVALAQAISGRPLAVLVGLGVTASVAGLVLAEFLALSRLLGTMLRKPATSLRLAMAVLFLVGNAAALINPRAVYADLLKPSLLALWISQVLVFIVYPRFVARHRALLVGDIALAVVASALMVFGLYSAAVSPSVS